MVIKDVFSTISFLVISLSTPVLQSRSHSNTPSLPPPPPPPSPPTPPPQLLASDSDPNLSGIPSSWSACWAVLSAQTLGAAPTLTQACLDYLHPRWCNPVLLCRMSLLLCCFIFSLFFFAGKLCRQCIRFPNDQCQQTYSFPRLESTMGSYIFKNTHRYKPV